MPVELKTLNTQFQYAEQNTAPYQRKIVLLQLITIIWMCAEAAVAIFAAIRAHSVALLGFGAGAIAPLVFGWVLDLHGGRTASVAGWGWAFSALGVGGVLGLLCMLWLRTMPESRRLAGGKR